MVAGLTAVRSRVAAAAERSGRRPAEVTLVVVGKDAAPDDLRAAYAAGVRDFGENRADQLVGRVAVMPQDVRWHFIGRLQRNKVARVRPVVWLLHSLDRLRLVERWCADGPPPPALVQVDVSGEPQKAGVVPSEVAGLVAAALTAGIEVRGLMTMAPFDRDPETARPHFAALRLLRERLLPDFSGLTELSMGMSGDFEVAVEEGATILRVGRAIFRPSPEEV